MTTQRHPALIGWPAVGIAPEVRRAPRAPADFEGAAVSLARWYLEFRSGRRPWDQLQDIVTTTVRQRLRVQSSSRLGTPGLDPVVRTLVQQTSDMRVDAVVLVSQGDRVLAVTVAFARDNQQSPWRVVELTTPHDDDRTLALALTTPEDEEDRG